MEPKSLGSSMALETVYCGYADILVHLQCLTLRDLKQYNTSIASVYSKMRVNEDWWLANKERLHKSVTNQ